MRGWLVEVLAKGDLDLAPWQQVGTALVVGLGLAGLHKTWQNWRKDR